MALYKGKKALYEAITTKTAQPRKDREAAVPLRRDVEPVRSNPAKSSSLFRWPTKPKAFQHSGGRLDISLSVPVAITAGLGLLAVLLLVFQVGKFAASNEQPIAASALARVETARVPEPQRPAARETRAAQPAAMVSVEAPVAEVPASNRTNRIVIQQYQVSRDLEPVQAFFATHGIETQIVSRMVRGRQMFFLVTAEMFESTVRPGSDGFQMLQKIRRLGAGYEAPPQYESFAPRLFSDAYGERVSQ